MNVKEVLKQIEARADLRIGWEAVVDDVPKLVAALRAVLAYADSIDHPDHYENAEREQVCMTCHTRSPFRGASYWPCSYRHHAEALRATIAESLGSTR